MAVAIKHQIKVTEQLSLFEEYSSEWTITCSCGYVHTTTDEGIHDVALEDHQRVADRQAAIETAKRRHPCRLPTEES